MSKVKVPLFRTSPSRAVTIDADATVGARIGVDLLMPDGTLATTAKLQALLGSTPGNSNSGPTTTDELDEGAHNRYFTAARAAAAAPIQSVRQGSGVLIDNTDPRNPVINATGGSAASGGVPYIVTDGSTYAVPYGIQALFTIPIDLEGSADLDVSGHLVEVA